MVPADSDRISRVPPYSGYHYLLSAYVYGPITPFGQTFQTVPLRINSNRVVLQPQNCLNNSGLGYSPFDRHYLGNHYCFLFLRLMRCFSSPGLPPDCSGYHDCSWWVVPFGNPRIDSYLPIPAAYRSLSRPSSPLRAKASSVRPCLFSFALLFPIHCCMGPKNFCLLWFVSNMSKIVRNYIPAPERTELRFSDATKGVEPLYAACVAVIPYFLFLITYSLLNQE